jgi:hypothetical protein
MRKQITHEVSQRTTITEDQVWLDLEHLARIELTSEDRKHPIESALAMNSGPGWRAQQPGKQMIRLIFDKPRRINRIQLKFQEDERERTQEFVLRWTPGGGAPYREIVRQQYNFSPPDSSHELEDYTVDLDGLTILELDINPDISGRDSVASLTQLRLA